MWTFSCSDAALDCLAEFAAPDAAALAALAAPHLGRTHTGADVDVAALARPGRLARLLV